MKQDITKELLKTEIEENKMPIYKLAEKTGRSAWFISKKIKEFGIQVAYCNLRNKQKMEIFEKFLTYDFLYENFVTNGYSALFIVNNKIPKETPISVNTLQTYAKKIGIKTPNYSESSRSKSCQKQRRETLKNRYGEDNPSKIQSVKESKERKALEKYGVKNVFQAQEIKEKSRKTMFRNYGCYNPISLPHRLSGVRSGPHRIVEDFLQELGINFKSEVEIFNKFNDRLQRDFSPVADIVIEDVKLVIEINGDIFHANPEIYKIDDIIKWGKHSKYVKDIWEYDKVRKEHIESFGYTVAFIWESEIKHNKQKTRDKINEIYQNLKNRKN